MTIKTLAHQGLQIDLLQDMSAVGLFLAQGDKPLHVMHLHEGDIFTLQLQRTKSHC
jgi:hypothetical protein